MGLSTRFKTWIFVKRWLIVTLGLWVIVTIVYHWWVLNGTKLYNGQKNYNFPSPYLHINKADGLGILEAPAAGNDIQIIENEKLICETIHICMVCMAKCKRTLLPVLKSLLHHRQNPIHFHFLVDTSNRHIISNLFDSWELPDVNYTCYDVERYLYKVQWIPNKHYAGIYTLVKLLIPDILPTSLDRVVVLDSDLTFVSDILELWNIFEKLNHSQLIGLVENESGWYLQSNRWPAIGQGFNSGVMLLDLKKIRSISWDKLWYETAEKNLAIYKSTDLGDQDIINSIIKGAPHLVFNMSCQFNVQMSSNNFAKRCYGNSLNNVKIVHWNSPLKQKNTAAAPTVFRNIHESYVNLDGYLLKDKLYTCQSTPDITLKLNKSDICSSFREGQLARLRTCLYYMDYTYSSKDNFDVTLVVQLSMDRIESFYRLAQHWDGPISAAIYLLDCEVPSLERFVSERSDTLAARRDIGYHLVFKHNSLHYPVNYLRNVALDNVNTPYVFLMDVDFVPMNDLYEYLLKATAVISPAPMKKCLVVPAFETQRYRASPPRTKSSLVAQLKKGGDVAPFRAHEWPKGHRTTNYSRWITADEPYQVEWHSDYEPYLVAHRSVPRYDTRFSGFGWNKVSHGVELRARGWVPWVLPHGFVTHTPHAPSLDLAAFRRDHHYRRCLSLLKEEFLGDLKIKYNFTIEEPKKNLEKESLV